MKTRLSHTLDSAGILLVFVLLAVALALFVPHFTNPENLRGLLLSVALVGTIACTMLLCLAVGDFDLSVGSVVALAGVLAALTINSTHSVLLAVALPILAGAAVGGVNGFVIARLGINPLITTLATMQIVRGYGLIISDGSSIGVSDTRFSALGQASYLGLQSPVWIMLGCFCLFGFLLNRTIFGRNALAIGGNGEAARLAGINVVRTKMAIFVLQGVVSAFAGVLLASRVTSGQPTTAQGLELQVISACVLGGVSLTGGVGTISGVIIGVLIMGMVENAMNLRNISPFYQSVVRGGILLAAVMFDRLKQRR